MSILCKCNLDFFVKFVYLNVLYVIVGDIKEVGRLFSYFFIIIFDKLNHYN